MAVNDSGRLDVYQWFMFLALHARRHLAPMVANEALAFEEMGWNVIFQEDLHR